VNEATVAAVTDEFERILPGGIFTRAAQLSKASFAVDLRLPDSLYLFISVEPGSPRTYLIKRRHRELEKITGTPGQFALALTRELSDLNVSGVNQIANERVIRIAFANAKNRAVKELVIQLTGSSSNIFLLDHDGTIIASSRENHGEGQEIGCVFSPPERTGIINKGEVITALNGSISAALDAQYLEQQKKREFASRANSARSRLAAEIAKREKLLRNLENDLRRHGDADNWKRFGDLLLANVSTAERTPGKITVVDYFDENLPKVDIDADDEDAITETAEKYFRRYTRSRNAADEIGERMKIANGEREKLRAKMERLETAIETVDVSALDEFAPPAKRTGGREKPKHIHATASGYRTFLSSDGYEILVGKKAKDNDLLTFRVAKSLDTWMHAADYPGSHVVVRNPNRGEIPHRTLIEAAKFAAFYSQGKSQTKAAVHYTQRKFVHKPKGAAPGLVSLASFKTLLVEPTPPDIKEK
jgi:predicted ribosome quality control (RQC) complex YloA/Tae2 family protein